MSTNYLKSVVGFDALKDHALIYNLFCCDNVIGVIQPIQDMLFLIPSVNKC